MYASTSTIWATRRPEVSSLTSVAPRRPRPAARVGPERRSRSSVAVSARRDVERLEIRRDQQPEHADEAGNDPAAEELGRRRGVDHLVERAEERKLALALCQRRDPERGIEDHDDAQHEQQRLDDAEDATDDLVGSGCSLEQRL